MNSDLQRSYALSRNAPARSYKFSSHRALQYILYSIVYASHWLSAIHHPLSSILYPLSTIRYPTGQHGNCKHELREMAWANANTNTCVRASRLPPIYSHYFHVSLYANMYMYVFACVYVCMLVDLAYTVVCLFSCYWNVTIANWGEYRAWTNASAPYSPPLLLFTFDNMRLSWLNSAFTCIPITKFTEIPYYPSIVSKYLYDIYKHSHIRKFNSTPCSFANLIRLFKQIYQLILLIQLHIFINTNWVICTN